VTSLFQKDENVDHEVMATILSGHSFRLERIASYGAASPGDFWYDQDKPEWVALIRGSAALEFLDGTLHLHSGDCLVIDAHLKHRVASTSRDAIWMALHFEADSRESA